MASVEILQAIILGVIQGLTEWLPISSSGHLALVQLAMNLEVPVFYDAVLHLGTLTGVIAVYRKDIIGIFKSIFGHEPEGRYPQGKKMLWFVVLGTIPTAAIGISFRSFFEYSFHDPLSIGTGFIVTGSFLIITKLLKSGKEQLTSTDAVLIGVGQGLSIFSSISRSGATVAAGMFRGIEREQLVRYSFLLSIPAILGAVLVDVVSAEQRQWAELNSIGVESYLLGAGISAIVGYASIRVLVNLVLSGKFYLFAFYSFAIGIMTFFLL